MGFFGKLFGLHKKCESGLRQLQESIVELQSEMKHAELDHKNETLNLNSNIAKLSSDYTTLEDRNKLLSSNNKELNEAKQNFDCELSKRTEKITGLESLLKHKERSINAKESTIKDREEELIRYESMCQDNEQKLEAATKKYIYVEKEYNILQANCQDLVKNAGQNKLQFEFRQREARTEYDKKLYALQVQLGKEYGREYGVKCSQTIEKYFRVYFSLRHWHPTFDIMRPMQRAFLQLAAIDKQDCFLNKLENACRTGEDSVRAIFTEYGQEMKQINSRYQNQNGGQSRDQNSQQQNHQSGQGQGQSPQR